MVESTAGLLVLQMAGCSDYLKAGQTAGSMVQMMVDCSAEYSVQCLVAMSVALMAVRTVQLSAAPRVD